MFYKPNKLKAGRVDTDLCGFVIRIECQVRIFPVSPHSISLHQRQAQQSVTGLKWRATRKTTTPETDTLKMKEA